MKILYNSMFYILALASLICGAFCVFDRNIVRCAKSAVCFFVVISFLIFLCKAPFCGILHLLIWGVFAGGLIVCLAKLTAKAEKEACKKPAEEAGEDLPEHLRDEETLNKKDAICVKAPKDGFLLNFKTLFVPVIGVIFILCIVPFILLDFKGFNLQEGHGVFAALPLLFTNNGVALIAFMIFVLCAFIGLSSILNIKNVYKKCKALKKQPCCTIEDKEKC